MFFEHGIDRGWVADNQVQRAEKPRRRGTGASPDLQFLSMSELDAVIRAIPRSGRDPEPRTHEAWQTRALTAALSRRLGASPTNPHPHRRPDGPPSV